MPTLTQLLASERLRFPGLQPRELLVLRAWLAMNENQYDSIEGNVLVGSGLDPGPGYPQYIRDAAIHNSKLRVDAVLRKGSDVALAEVKDRGGAGAVGQLIVYKTLWMQEHPTEPAPTLLLIAAGVQLDVVPALTAAGIALHLVHPDFSVLARR